MIYQSPLTTPARITAEYAAYGTTGVHHHHAGIDLVHASEDGNQISPPENGIRPVSPGIVFSVNFSSTLGNYVIIQHTDPSGAPLQEYSLYAHLAAPSRLIRNESVGLESVVGTMGNTGTSVGPTGIHLHFSLHLSPPLVAGAPTEGHTDAPIGSFTDDNIVVVENWAGNNDPDDDVTYLRNEGPDNWIHALIGNDEVHGSQSADRIHGGLGNDSIYGNGGNDSIRGGSEYRDPRDTDVGLPDDDDLRGGSGNDTIFGGAGNDTIYGGGIQSNPGGRTSDDDVIFGGIGDDHIFGEIGNDLIYGGSGDEVNGDTAYFEPVTRPGDEFLIEFQADGGVRVEQVSTSNLLGTWVNGTDTLYGVENISFGGLGRPFRVADFSSGDKIKVVPNSAVNPLLTSLDPGRTLWLVAQANGPLFLQLAGSADDYELQFGSQSSGGEFAIRSVLGGQRFELISDRVYVSIGGGQFQTLVQALAPIAATPDDHGDTRDTATLVNDLDGTAVRGNIEVSGDGDFFRFSTQFGQIFGVVATPDNSGVNPEIRVYNSSGQLVASNADLGSGPSAGLSFTSSGGTYYVEISGQRGSTGDYGIGVSLLGDGSGGTAPGDASEPDADIDTTTSRRRTHEGNNNDNSWIFSSSSSTEVFIVMNGGDDIARTGRRDDIVFGGSGDDVIQTRDGDDTIDGGNDEDVIEGGDGNDGILGGRDDDTIDGGNGNDVIAGQHGDDRIDGGNGNDVISGGDGHDRLDGGSGDDGILGDDGDDDIDGGSGRDTIYGGDDDDRIDGETGRDALYGGRGRDFIRGGEDSDRIVGGDGDDELLGEEGNDSISGGSGDDIIRPGSGDDTVDGDGGSDTLSYEEMNGGATIDMTTETAYGAEIGFDRFDSVDHIIGTNGNDIIIGDGDDNRLSGDSGQDIITGGAGNDQIDGGSSTDTAVFSGNRADYTITASTNPEFALQIVDNRPGSPDGTDLLNSISFLQFADVRIRDDDALSAAPTANDDSFVASSQGPVIVDVLANDTDPDGNTLFVAAIVSQPEFGRAYVVDNRIIYEPAGELSGATDQVITFTYKVSDGTGWFDEATATILLETPDPDVPADPDPDVPADPDPDVSASNLNVVMRTDGSGLFDATFEVTNNGPDLPYGTAIALRLSADQTIYWEGDYFLGSASTGELASGETVLLEISGVDLDWVRNYATFIPGTYYFAVEADYSDSLEESDEQDNISNLVPIELTSPNLTLNGGDGNDNLQGMNGNDRLFGGAGDDRMSGGAGADVLNGGNGIDRAQYTDATAGVLADLQYADRNTGFAAGDTYVSIEGFDGSRYDDDLRGDAANNVLWGHNGNDRLHGRGGNDNLQGMNGNDRLFGGTGDDRMTGGIDGDTFVFLGNFGHDIITDLDITQSGERIDLSAVLSITDFTDLSNNHLSQSGGNTMISDGRGNTITMLGVNMGDLTADDFLF